MSYVNITRDDLEDWLDSFARQSPYKGWVRDRSKAGVYIVRFSKLVGCKIVTTLTRNDDVKGRGKASTKMALVRVSDGFPLNKKAAPQKYYRTINWRDTWLKKGVEWWRREVYVPKIDFYESIAEIEDRDAYREEWVALIESIPNHQDNKFLSDMLEKVRRGNILTPKMRSAIEKVLSSPKRETPQDELSPQQRQFVQRLRTLIASASAAGDTWTTQFASSILSKIERYGASARLSQRQKEILRQKLSLYRA